jgi:hypothetical protein
MTGAKTPLNLLLLNLHTSSDYFSADLQIAVGVSLIRL